MKFKIDENLPVEAVALLQALGHEALTVAEQGLGGRGDPEIASVCQRERLVFLTLDTDFSDIRSYPPDQYYGFIVLRLTHRDKPHVLSTLAGLTPVLSTQPLEGRLWIVEETRIRTRG